MTPDRNRAFVRALIEQVRIGNWTPEQTVTYLASAELNPDLTLLTEAVRLTRKRHETEAALDACIDKLAQPRVTVGGDCE